MRLLGAFIGNDIENASIWTPTVEAIIKNFKQWNKGRLTLERCWLIINIVVESRTQFRTRVQGMSKCIEDLLVKLMRDFLLDTESKPTVGINMLRLPLNMGSHKALDIRIRNKAIEIMKAQRYLKIDGRHPKWAQIVDKLISAKITKKPKSSKISKINIFPQNTTVDTRAGKDCLPPSLQCMIKVARKYKVAFTLLVVDRGLKDEMLV